MGNSWRRWVAGIFAALVVIAVALPEASDAALPNATSVAARTTTGSNTGATVLVRRKKKRRRIIPGAAS
ncbi:MAG TPA: hypothetical protein VHY20_15895 [Pirellulales bacterium]|nr:hypothetical protein [Pirellulales bacterium]